MRCWVSQHRRERGITRVHAWCTVLPADPPELALCVLYQPRCSRTLPYPCVWVVAYVCLSVSCCLPRSVQYANRPDIGTSFWGRGRHYADGVNKVRAAAKAWADANCVAAVNLGDAIDRSSADPEADLATVLDAFQGFAGQYSSLY